MLVVGHLTPGLLDPVFGLWLFLSCHANDKSDFAGTRTGFWLLYLTFGCLLPQLFVSVLSGASVAFSHGHGVLLSLHLLGPP